MGAHFLLYFVLADVALYYCTANETMYTSLYWRYDECTTCVLVVLQSIKVLGC